MGLKPALGRQYEFTFDYVATLLAWLQFGSTGDRPKWHQINAGMALSKRTDLHFSAIYQRLAGDASVVAINFFAPAGAGRTSQIALLAGLRHRF